MKTPSADTPAHRLSLKIADIIIRVDSSVALERFNDFGFYRDFIVANEPSCHCRLVHAIGPPAELALDKNPFHTQNWQLAKAGRKNVLRVGPGPLRGKPDNVVVFDHDYREGMMYQKSVFELFRRFIDQFVVINLLSRQNGFLLHAAGVVWEGKGICFAGPSGAGKSTLLNLFGEEVAGKCLLNDDRCALSGHADRWRVFGTPWYGESRISSSGSAELSSIFFIRHSKNNYVRRLSAGEICRHLLVLGLLPLWDEKAVSRVMGTFKDLIRRVPAYELGFLPDASAVDLIKKTV